MSVPDEVWVVASKPKSGLPKAAKIAEGLFHLTPEDAKAQLSAMEHPEYYGVYPALLQILEPVQDK